jgi:hypothetical protein
MKRRKNMAVTKTVAPVKSSTKRKTEYDPKDRRERMQGYMRAHQEIWFDFAVDASLCYHEDQWQEWTHPETNEPYESFGQCAEGEWGISYKVAMMRVAMGDAIREHGLTKEMVGTEMGWAKFHAITSAFHEDIKKGEVNTLLKKAQKLSLADLKEFVKEVKTERIGGEVQKRTTLKYTLLNEMAEVVQNAINLAKEIMGIDDDGLALEYVMAEWQANHNPKLKDKIMEQLHGEAVETDEEEEAPKATRKKSAATKKKEKTVAKNEKATKTKAAVVEDEDEFEDDEEENEEEAPAPKAKAKATVKGKKAVVVVDEEEFDDDDDEDDEDEFEEEE